FINARYGQKDWQQTYDNGELRVVDEVPEGFTSFLADGTLTRRAECSWLFQMSQARARRGEISKLLNCRGAGAYLVNHELGCKIVGLDFTVNPVEDPARYDIWIVFPQGWKPCLPKPGAQRCQILPLFQTFKRNGRECTVYPKCTE